MSKEAVIGRERRDRLAGASAMALSEDARIQLADGDVAAAIATAAEAVSAARAARDDRALGWALIRSATGLARRGDNEGCAAACAEAVRRLEAVGDALGVARALSLSAVVATFRGRVAEGVADAARTVALLADIDDESIDLAATHANIGSILVLLGDGDAAAAHDRRAVEIARRLGAEAELLALQTHAIVTIADRARRDAQGGDQVAGRARAAEGLAEARAAVNAARRESRSAARATLEVAAADLLNLAGRPREALLRIDAAIHDATALGQPQVAATANMVRGAALRGLGRLDEAAEALDLALTAAEPLGFPGVLADIHHERSLLFESLGRHAEALEAYRRFHRLGESLHRGEGARQVSTIDLRLELEEAREAGERDRARVQELSKMVDLLRDQSRELARTSLEDPVTGLPNRRALDALLAARLRAQVAETGSLCVAIVDVDHFKEVNDRHGHLAGDAVLRRIAEILRVHLRGHDVAARFGGDEFVVLLDGVDGERAERVCERVRQEIAAADWDAVEGAPESVTVSVGVATSRDGQTVAGLLAAADGALYRAKSLGRDRVSVA